MNLSTFLRNRCAQIAVVVAAFVIWRAAEAPRSHAIEIRVDYRYDTENFFNTGTSDGQQARVALEAAAARYSAIITSPLAAVSLTDGSTDPRIGFNHPGNGLSWDVSSASSEATDALSPEHVSGGKRAQEYRGAWSIPANEWILYAGAHSFGPAGQGGTGTGLNFTSVFSDGNSVLNRGFRTSGSSHNLPVWGGAITFDNDSDRNWHFDVATAAVGGELDFYSIALHEIGHALGLGTGWDEWKDHSVGAVFTGANAVAAYNADNGASLTGLDLVSENDPHWKDGAYQAKIFAADAPDLVGTVGLGNPQDLLLDPVANFNFPTPRRFELTNVDVAALRDIGWDTITSIITPGDFNNNGLVNGADLARWQGDYGVNALSDANGDSRSDGADFLIWQRNYTGGGAVAAIPEPSGLSLCLLACVTITCLLPPRKR